MWIRASSCTLAADLSPRQRAQCGRHSCCGVMVPSSPMYRFMPSGTVHIRSTHRAVRAQRRARPRRAPALRSRFQAPRAGGASGAGLPPNHPPASAHTVTYKLRFDVITLCSCQQITESVALRRNNFVAGTDEQRCGTRLQPTSGRECTCARRVSQQVRAPVRCFRRRPAPVQG